MEKKEPGETRLLLSVGWGLDVDFDIDFDYCEQDGHAGEEGERYK